MKELVVKYIDKLDACRITSLVVPRFFTRLCCLSYGVVSVRGCVDCTMSTLDGHNLGSIYIFNYFVFCLELNYYVVYTLIFFAYMVGSSLLLLKGLNNNLRGFLLPWLIGMGFVVIFLLVWSIWLLYGYYIYVSNVYNIIL